jgi:hypothetical protein
MDQGRDMRVDLNEPDKSIAQLVTGQCSQCGTVVSVKIHRSPTTFALVEMSNHMQALELSSRFGGSTFGTSVLIHLH